MRGQPRRVVLVDDHTAFVELLQYALGTLEDLSCVGSAGSLADAEAVVAAQSPDVVIVDLVLGDDDGLDVVRRLRARWPELVLVVASARSDGQTLAAVSAAGANGFAPKRGAFTELLAILRSARPGTMSVAPAMMPLAAAPPAAEPGPIRLTRREAEVLALMDGGASVPAIARRLNISVTTCRGYVRGVHSKLGARTQVEAVLKARRIGLVGSADGP